MVIVTTLQTPKNILKQLQNKFGFTLFADLYSRDMQELSRIFRLFWIPKSSYQKKILAKILLPIKIRKSKISNPKKSFDRPCHLKSGEPPCGLPGVPHLNTSRPLVSYGIIINFMVCLSKFFADDIFFCHLGLQRWPILFHPSHLLFISPSLIILINSL